VVVRIDGQPAAESLHGGVINLDPGPHDFVFERPGLPPVTRQFVLQEGEPVRTETIVVGAPAAVPPKPPGVLPSPGSALRTWGLGLGIGGAVAMTAGAVVGFAAKSTYESAAQPVGGDPECSIGGLCTTDGASRQRTAHDWANVATGVFIGGAVLGVSGITLFVLGATAHGKRESSLVLLPTPTGALVRGAW
jgi:hypothetical protein